MNDKDLLLRRIANHLTINASFLDNCGLFYGKMGIALFLPIIRDTQTMRTLKIIWKYYSKIYTWNWMKVRRWTSKVGCVESVGGLSTY